jgi:hypothetical protein
LPAASGTDGTNGRDGERKSGGGAAGMGNLALMVPQKHLMPSMTERTRSVNRVDRELERAIRIGRQDDPVPDRAVRHRMVQPDDLVVA